MPEPTGSPFVLTDAATLGELVRREVAEAIKEVVPSLLHDAKRKPWLTRQEAQEQTGLNSRKLAYLRKTRQVTFSQRGRTILYETASLLRYLDGGVVSARQSRF